MGDIALEFHIPFSSLEKLHGTILLSLLDSRAPLVTSMTKKNHLVLWVVTYGHP